MFMRRWPLPAQRNRTGADSLPSIIGRHNRKTLRRRQSRRNRAFRGERQQLARALFPRERDSLRRFPDKPRTFAAMLASCGYLNPKRARCGIAAACLHTQYSGGFFRRRKRNRRWRIRPNFSALRLREYKSAQNRKPKVQAARQARRFRSYSPRHSLEPRCSNCRTACI